MVNSGLGQPYPTSTSDRSGIELIAPPVAESVSPIFFESLSAFEDIWKKPPTVQRKHLFGHSSKLNPECLGQKLSVLGHNNRVITNFRNLRIDAEIIPADRPSTLTQQEVEKGVVAEYPSTISWTNDGRAERADTVYRQKFPVEVYIVDLEKNKSPAIPPPKDFKSTPKVLNLSWLSPRREYPSDYDGDGNPYVVFGYIEKTPPPTPENGVQLNPFEELEDKYKYRYALVMEFQKPVTPPSSTEPAQPSAQIEEVKN